MIELNDLSKSFGNIQALSHISARIQKGEIMGLLGPNGAGKTTLMRILTGILEPDQGSISIDSTNALENKMAMKSRLGYLAENNPLYEDMLVCEYLRFIADLRLANGNKKDAIDAVVKETDIGSVFYRPIGDLSKGFRQRIGLAQAMMAEPDVLILDEPTEGLDPNQRVDMRSLIRNIGKNKTVLVSTHVLSEVEQICDRLLIIDRGRLIADGTVSDIISQASIEHQCVVELSGPPLTEQDFLGIDGVKGMSKMNPLDGRVQYFLTIDSAKNVPVKIFEFAKKKNLELWELHQEKMDIEQVFRQLTHE